MMGFKIENNNTCRVCLKTKPHGIFSIYEKISQEYTEPIFSMIIYCASVNISKEDGLPDVVCESCRTRLETAYLFKRDCEQSDAKLRMKIEIDYNFKQENNNDSENCIETIDTENIKLENDTKLQNYENNDESMDIVYPNMFAKAEINDLKIPLEISTNTSENPLVENSDNPVSDKEDNENDIEYRPKKLNRKRKKKTLSVTKLRKIICYVCIKTFSTQSDYNTHITQHPNQKYSCDVENCDIEFSNYIKYAIHRKNIHSIENYLTCKDCQKKFNNKRSFDRHVLNLHGERPYGCLKCSKMFREESALVNHMEKIHSKEYKCEFCEKVFSTSFRLSTHRRLHTQEKPFVCQDCGKSWIDKSSLTKHIDAHHSGKPEKKREKNHLCSYCGRAFDRISHLEIHVSTHTGLKRINCDQCDYRCSTNSALQSHMRKHTGERPYKCSYCEKSYPSRSWLIVHERFHSGDRPYICNTCKKGFTNKKDLKVHERTHTGIKLFTCNVCNNSFTTRHYLRVHTEKHNGTDKPKRKREKNHLCSYCGQAYNRLDLLTKHIRRHTGSKPFSCDHCDYRSRDQQSLRSHIRTHTGDRPYKCSYCEKSFSTRGYLTIHERFHSGHRPYICSACKKGFTNSKDLKVHERTHTGIKLFTCNICSNSFTTLHYLRVHTKKHDT